MKILQERILSEGKGLGSGVVKVDGFLNHMIDVALMEKIGEEFARRFADAKVDKILTVEASGIAVACIASKYFGYVPVVFAKKTTPNTMLEDFYSAEAKSFTKGSISLVRVAKKYINKDEKILIIDDFLAHGQAGLALAEIVRKGEGQVVGLGAVIEKKFQGGADRLRAAGVRVESLAVIEKVEAGKIHFSDDYKE
ncbi:MAG: xanthine phosphoribosyltransferase [Eubacteriales bacterium]|nr:xanthine phosphoribosyltransferase [Eubacteriales bacterium]MDD4389990.1 xanthine phosphoribosyltransferase [Eubacteriales bacterium]